MYIFDTKVQHLQYKVLRTVARHAWKGDFYDSILDIPKEIIPGKTPTMRCCVYKERAILSERVKLAAGGDKTNPNVIEALEIACDDCPTEGYVVSEACRGCIAHRCEDICPRGAISHDESHHAHIDKSKCINCGKCAQACPYSAIYNRKRPCQTACKTGAITMNDDGTVRIDDDLCVSCGACVFMCPWGALSDKSDILQVIKWLKAGERVCALVAPSIVSQFSYASPGQVITAIRELGFEQVLEVALGADMTAYAEAQELAEKGFLMSSCCPAFVSYVQSQHPAVAQYISHTPSPMVSIARHVREADPEIKIVFIGPCTAKKSEIKLPEVQPYVDSVLTFEELQALFDSRDLDVVGMEETNLDNASGYGRGFAHSGGLAQAVAQALKEQGSDFELKPMSCSGLDECRIALLKASKGRADFNFLEGMACPGGCINGAGCMTHNDRSRLRVDESSRAALRSTITDAVKTAEAALQVEGKKHE